MRFFLVGRDRTSGDVRILTEQTFTSRQDALDSLSTLDADASSFDATDLFVVDLEAVTPVVLYRPAAVPAEEPIAAAWEAPVIEPDEALGGLLEPVEPAGEPSPVEAGEQGLAAALRRAATRMESEGVQPAATVEEVIAAQEAGDSPVEVAEVAAEEPPAAEPEEPEAVWEPEAPAPGGDEVAGADSEGEPVEEAVAEAAEVEAVAEPEEAVAEPEEAVAEPENVPDSDGSAVDDDLAAELDALAGPVEDVTPEAPQGLLGDDEGPAAPAGEGLLSLADLPVPEAAEEPAADAEPASWPWEATPALEAPGVVEPASLQFTPTGIEEAAACPPEMLAAPEDDFTPKPVIMGDYGLTDDFVTIDEPASEAPAQAVEDAPVMMDELGIPAEWLTDGAADVVIEPGEPVADETGMPAAEPAEVDAAPEVGSAGGADPVDEAIAADPAQADVDAGPTYQPEPIDMDAYTCDDCVYAGTCPKAGQDRPATCGSFQWKSV